MATELIEEDSKVTELRSTNFPQFDVADDIPDHHHAKIERSLSTTGSELYQAIGKEMKILQKNLPDSIYVRVSEQKIYLMRVVIIGPAGTPYHDGLFFFDILFPLDYPQNPPQVYYKSFCLRVNPNLYKNGVVCLSLLNTWAGQRNEMWIPKQSTVLQVLVSIQALVLNEKPIFNEPSMINTREKLSREYSDQVFVLSCKSMAFLLNNPPKKFEEFVVGHFRERSSVILTACQAYMNGFETVGYFQKGVASLEKRIEVSKLFKASMKIPYWDLVSAFRNIDPTCGEFLLKLDELVMEAKKDYKVRRGKLKIKKE